VGRAAVRAISISPEEHLAKSDPVLRKLIRKLPPCAFPVRPRRSPFESLASAIAHQQLNGTAAQTILGRFVALFPDKRFPSAEDLGRVTDAQIRAAGFSRAKIAALRDLAAKTIDGVGARVTRHSPAERRRDRRAAHCGARRRPVDGRDALDLPARPPRRAPG
jgi:3-methyladenine DNA glycosylase/8-oxoguanine DNA glycosylase